MELMQMMNAKMNRIRFWLEEYIMDYLNMIDDVKEEQVDLKEKFIKEQMEK